MYDVFAPNQFNFLIIFLITPDCLVQLIEQITKSLDNCEFAVLLFFKLDL